MNARTIRHFAALGVSPEIRGDIRANQQIKQGNWYKLIHNVLEHKVYR